MRRLLARALELGAAAGLLLLLAWKSAPADLWAAVGTAVVSALLAVAARAPERETAGLRARWLRPYASLPWEVAREAVRVWATLLRRRARGAWNRTRDPRARDPEAAHRALVAVAESASASRAAVGLDPERGLLVAHDFPMEGHG